MLGLYFGVLLLKISELGMRNLDRGFIALDQLVACLVNVRYCDCLTEIQFLFSFSQ